MGARRVAGRLELLRRVPSFRLLFLATLGSGIGTWFAFVALTIDVYDRTGSAVWVSALLIADFLPMVLIGLFFAPLVDRLSRKRLMIEADLVRCAAFCVLPFAGSALAIVVIAAIIGFATGIFRPAVFASLPNVVDDSDLPQANSLLQSVENLTWMIAPLLGGLLADAWGPDPAYWFNAVTFLVSALLIARIPARVLQSVRAQSRGRWRDIAAGFALVRRSRALLTVFVAWNVFMLAAAAVNVAEIFLARDTFDAEAFGYGLLVGATGFGLVIGSLWAGSLLARYEIASVYGISVATIAVGIGAAAISPNIWAAALCVVLFGVGNGAAVVCNALLVQRGAPDELRGRAFTLIMAANQAVLGLGMILAGPLTNAIGPRWMWGVAAVLSALAAGLGYVFARPVQAPAETAAAEPATASATASH